jgi:cytochrome c oxidase subunit 2
VSSPIRSPEGVWWNDPLRAEEKRWLGIVGITMVILFGWMIGWMYAGSQNPTGPSYRIDTPGFRAKMTAYKDSARQTDRGIQPAGEDVYIAGFQWGWDGLPVVLEAGRRYRFHLYAYDVQHGFGVHSEKHLWKQVNLQLVPGYEWVVPFEFDEPGVYHVICNEFCGVGHRVMNNRFVVVEGGAPDGD